MTFHHILHPYAKINSKQIHDQNMLRPETIKLLEEKRRENLHDTGVSDDFLNMTLKAQATKEKNRQTGLHDNFKLLFIKRYCI